MESSNPSKQGAELLNISIDLGNGLSDTLKIFEHDDLRLTVRKFYIKNDISSDGTEEILLQKVHRLIEEVLEEHKLINMALAARPLMSASPCKNFGEKLYQRSMQEKDRVLVKNQMKRINSAKQIQESVIGRPKINSNSMKILSKNNSKACSVKTNSSPKSNSFSETTIKYDKQSENGVRKCVSRLELCYQESVDRRNRSETMNTTARDSESPMKNSVFKSKSPLLSKTPNKKIIACKNQKLNNSTRERKHFSIEIDKETGKKVFMPITGESIEKNASHISSNTDMIKTQKDVFNPNFYQYQTPVKPSNKSFTARNEVKSKSMVKIS
ncbi:hypothetical protein SteCoe_34687 [Stentor coeruleus]|uniref:Uncharacterized protein n=1 Tax=Stentor coeruleus TaxID=5963 RepID=A0A1R2AU12_9CILI|nr:hypothetical protein SteCoe_34687 [Stentor coeruleus]